MTTIVTNQEASNNIHQNLIEDCKRMDQKAQFQIYKARLSIRRCCFFMIILWIGAIDFQAIQNNGLHCPIIYSLIDEIV